MVSRNGGIFVRSVHVTSPVIAIVSIDTSTRPTTASRPRSDLPPLRLRLHHLFALTAVAAILLALAGPRDLSGLEAPPLLQLSFTGLGIVYTILASVAITFTAYGFAWRRQGRPFFDEPGHWLLVTIAVQQLLSSLLQFSVWLLTAFQGQAMDAVWAESPRLTTWLAPGLMLLAFNVYIGRTKCPEPHWTQVLYFKAAAELVPVIGDFLVLLFLKQAVGLENPGRRSKLRWPDATGYVPPVVGDFREERQRCTAHRCGVIIQFAISGLTIFVVFGIFTWLFWRFFTT